jgi:hypothetical protein
MAKKTIEQLDVSIARWQTRLKRAVNAIERLQKQKKRMLKKPELGVPASVLVKAVKSHITRSAKPEPDRHPIEMTITPTAPGEVTVSVIKDKVEADTGIPEFLRRGQAAQKAADDVIADQLRTGQAETKRLKAQGRIAKMKAKKSGETKKMPLSGKAALEAIRNG